MATLKFASSHNMVAFLDKPTESDRFEQIVDCLNAHPIKYALTVNPTIYTTCIEQFWDTIKVKTINGEVQIQELVDKKKCVVWSGRGGWKKERGQRVKEGERRGREERGSGRRREGIRASQGRRKVRAVVVTEREETGARSLKRGRGRGGGVEAEDSGGREGWRGERRKAGGERRKRGKVHQREEEAARGKERGRE
ncbi:hypothetical protein Tco_0840802 [Tanacetum coccineum]|uniref:Xylulose kinase-1 n=1 Tax=Tanacetum coccineum TaxID=301880 RepID=A0ABQ5AUN1_9ASTR